MSDSSQAVLLNQGLDLVSPPLLAKEGALIECLNYEMTGDAGYRRIDGYERYDGFPDGGVANFLVVSLTADVPADQSALVEGSVLNYLNSDGTVTPIGVVVDDAANPEINYVAFRRTVTIHTGDNIYVLTPSGTSFSFTATSDSISGKLLIADAPAYTQQLRDYSTQLRASVIEAPSAVAGLNYSRDRLYEAVDVPAISFTVLSASLPAPSAGMTIRWKGQKWMVMAVEDTVIAGGNDTSTYYLMPLGATTPVSDAFIEINSAGTAVKTYATVAASPSYTEAKYATMGYANNPEISEIRGFTYLTPAAMVNFDAGSFAGGVIPPDGIYWVVGGGSVMKVSVKGLVQLDGSFTDGTASGRLQVTILEQVSGTRNYIDDNDVIHSVYPTTGTSAVFTVNGDPIMPVLAGTGSLRLKNTRYQWGTYNFYADSGRYELYGCNGVFRAFWADRTSWGNIITQDDAALDNPKYLSFHAGNNLALGFAEGSVQLSVGGDPTNYNGTQGALEIGTGDNVTGLLEASGDSTLVFGKRSIRRITGTNDASLSLRTVVSNAGAYDYTAVNVAGQPVYCDPNGVATLQQSSAYGDFVGQRSTYNISTWLYPKLVASPDSIEIGGVACAMPVRKKNQYRLFLNSGEVVSICFTTEGAKVMVSDYALQITGDGVKDVRTPLAWSSEVDDTGIEQLHVVWDLAISEQGQDGRVGTLPNPMQPYRMDYGWGFDGATFAAYFDTAHTFLDNGSQMNQIVKVRLHGVGYGLATLDISPSSIERDFDQPFQRNAQDISLPDNQEFFYDRMKPVTNIVAIASWGLGVKLRVKTSLAENTPLTEPSHICQVLINYMDTEGAQDN